MRARLLPAWPALSELFGLHPRDVDHLAPAEWNRYLRALEERAEESERQRIEANRASARARTRR